jgi:hypothetical protein
MNLDSLEDFSVENIIDFKSIDITQISYSSPTKVKGGSYMSIPTYQGKKIFIQTPRLLNNNGILKTDNRSSIELEFDKSHWNFYEFITDIDDFNIIQIQKNSETWFNKEFPLDIVEDFYKSPVKVGRGKKPPCLKLKVPISRGEISCSIYDKGNQLIRYNDIPNQSKILCVLWLSGLRFLKQQVICEWHPIQLKVFFNNNNPRPSYVINDSLLSDDEHEYHEHESNEHESNEPAPLEEPEPIVTNEPEPTQLEEPIVTDEANEHEANEHEHEHEANEHEANEPEQVTSITPNEPRVIFQEKETIDESPDVSLDASPDESPDESLDESLRDMVKSLELDINQDIEFPLEEINLNINANETHETHETHESEPHESETHEAVRSNLDKLQKYKELLETEYSGQMKNIAHQQKLLTETQENEQTIDYQKNITQLNLVIQEKDKRLQLLENKIKELINLC